MLLSLALAIAVGSTAESPPEHPLDDSFVSVRVVGGFSPYRAVSYEVLWRAKVAVAGHYRGLVNYDEAMHAMKLVPTGEYTKLLDQLAKDGVFELKDAAQERPEMGALRYEIEVRHGARHVLAKVTGPPPGSRYAHIIARVQAFVVARAGDLPFRNVFFEPGTYGFVNLTAVPVCRVWVDGRDTGLETPVYGYELPAGEHEVRLVAIEEGWERSHTLRVEPGMTTIVHFDLR